MIQMEVGRQRVLWLAPRGHRSPSRCAIRNKKKRESGAYRGGSETVEPGAGKAVAEDDLVPGPLFGDAPLRVGQEPTISKPDPGCGHRRATLRPARPRLGWLDRRVEPAPRPDHQRHHDQYLEISRCDHYYCN